MGVFMPDVLVDKLEMCGNAVSVDAGHVPIFFYSAGIRQLLTKYPLSAHKRRKMGHFGLAATKPAMRCKRRRRPTLPAREADVASY